MASRTICVFAIGIVLAGVSVASAQRRTIPEMVARGESGGVGSVPSGPGPSMRTLLDSTDVLVVGRLGEPQGYLSDDQMRVFTDYRVNEPVILFERKPRVAPTASMSPSIVLTQRGGTVNVQGTPFTELEAALRPLKAGTQVLCLLKQAGEKYQIVGWYYGVFEIKNGAIEPLMTSGDFAQEYRGRPLKEAEQSMLAVLRASDK